MSKLRNTLKERLAAGPGGASHISGDSENPLTEEEKKTAAREARKARIKERRATFDLDPAIRRLLRAWSGHYGVPQSQMVMLAIIELEKLIEIDGIDIESMRSKSDSPKFAYNLELDEMIESLNE